MIKNESGVTLIILIITIVVLIIIASISIETGSETLQKIEDKEVETEVSTVQQAIFQQYTLLKTYKVSGIIPENSIENVTMENDVNRPKYLIGTRIVDVNTLADYSFVTYNKIYTEGMTFEEYYYVLNEADLEALGITAEYNAEKYNFAYIVNYSTGEVFDIENKVYVNIDETTVREENASLTGTGDTLKIEKNQYDFIE